MQTNKNIFTSQNSRPVKTQQNKLKIECPFYRDSILKSEKAIDLGKNLVGNRSQSQKSLCNPWIKTPKVTNEFIVRNKVRNTEGVFDLKGKTYPLTPSLDRINDEIKQNKFDNQKSCISLINKVMHCKFPSTKFIKEDFDKFIPTDFKEKMLAMDSSYESEEENPLKKLEEQEALEFYNMNRLLNNYTRKISKKDELDEPVINKGRRVSNWNLTMKEGPIKKFQPLQTQLLDMASSQALSKDWKPSQIEIDLKLLKHELNSENIKKIYKSELKRRSQGKELNQLDKLCVDLVGPAGSRERLYNDIEFIDDILCKRIYEKDRKLRGQSEQEKARLQRIQNNDKDEAIFSLLSTI